MHSLRSAAVQFTNYGTGGAFELPTQSGTYKVFMHRVTRHAKVLTFASVFEALKRRVVRNSFPRLLRCDQSLYSHTPRGHYAIRSPLLLQQKNKKNLQQIAFPFKNFVTCAYAHTRMKMFCFTEQVVDVED